MVHGHCWPFSHALKVALKVKRFEGSLGHAAAQGDHFVEGHHLSTRLSSIIINYRYIWIYWGGDTAYVIN